MGAADEDPELSYTTFADKADDARLAIEDEMIKVRNQVSNDLLGMTPPLSAEIMTLIPKTPNAPKAESDEVDAEGKANTESDGDGVKLHSGAARDIFFTDMRLGFQSVIGVVVIMLLVITPSLYAWFNIAGSWDPYSNTGNLKVAVANEDEGSKGELIPMRMNIGDTIVSQLRGESGFDWVFVDEDKAVEGVYDESYYAAIVIPKDFSRNMMTYLTDNADYPNVIYYTNEKENPIAPIITQKGANSIQEGIRSTFTQRVDEVGLNLAVDLADYVTNPNLSGYAAKMGKHLDDAIRNIGDGASAMRTLSSLSVTTANVVSTASVALEGIRASSDTAKNALGNAENGVTDASEAFATSATIVDQALSGSSGTLDSISEDIDASLADLESNTANVPGVIHIAADVLEDAAGYMREIAQIAQEAANEETDPEKREEALAEAARLAAFAESMTNLADTASSAANRSDGLADRIEDTRGDLRGLVVQADQSLDETRSFYHNSIESAANDVEATVRSTSDAIHAIMNGLEGSVAGLSENAGNLTSQLNTLSGELTETATKLDTTADNVSKAKKRLSDALSSGDMKQIESAILGSDPSTMSERMAAPLEEKREPLYSVANFGSAMAPFYTVLCLWVGALVLVSTLEVHVTEERMERLRRRYAKVRAFHEYVGRYGIFAFISLLQSLLVLLGDLCLLHIQCVHPILFVVFGVLIGQVFCLFVYTLSELFGDVGKALCVILLIMQVAASGGTFPVEMLDPMLSNIVPFLPFFHGMNLLKECVAGIYWPSVGGNVAFFLTMVGTVLLIGIAARKPFRKLDNWFEGQLEKTGFM
ncbi:MAG: YhgE/Pip domain-containing protein [Eggerthellaceae bacterium]|nr:YhgE/Pip domain-containing protein [Eggerthellaceae bacterium]